jgi:hypothetical protein
MSIGQCRTISTLRGLLEAAHTARREGDIALADMLEGDALVVLRTNLQAAKREART